MTNEPVRIVSMLVAIALAALPHLATFGVPLTHEQIDALNTFLPSLIVILGGEVARARVTSEHTLRQAGVDGDTVKRVADNPAKVLMVTDLEPKA